MPGKIEMKDDPLQQPKAEPMKDKMKETEIKEECICDEDGCACIITDRSKEADDTVKKKEEDESDSE